MIINNCIPVDQDGKILAFNEIFRQHLNGLGQGLICIFTVQNRSEPEDY